MPLSQTNEDHLSYYNTNSYPNFRDKIDENASTKIEEKEHRISVKILMQCENLLRQEIKPFVTISTNNKT